MSGLFTQFGMKAESVYGTPVVVDRFFELRQPRRPKLEMGRIDSAGIRPGLVAPRDDHTIVYRRGGSMPLPLEVPTKGFGIWLPQMGFTVALGAETDSNTTQTGTMVLGNMAGKSFTGQGSAAMIDGTVQPFTGHGGKIVSWSLGCESEGLLLFDADVDFEDVDTSTALATASFVTGALGFGFVGAAMTIGGSAVPLSKFKVGAGNTLDVNRRLMRGNGLKLEPLEGGSRTPTWSAECEFTSLTQFNRYQNALASGAHAAIVATFQGPIAHAGATLPSVVITIPAARFDDDALSEDLGPTKQMISGQCRTPAVGGSVLTIAYTTTDTAS